jgi:peptidoglycan/LPS O-acetylase OafA/YrhL
MQYRKDIDGLRAVAVLSVVWFHSKVPGFSGGFVGVDVFFVISGYLITGLIAGDCRAGRFSFKSFYFRRVKRILPALLCVYLASTLLALTLMLPSDMAAFARSLSSSAKFLSNHYFYNQAGYFGGQSDLKPLLHTWSLSIEEQFYLVWPVVFLAAARWRPTAMLYPVWAAGAVSLAVASIVVSQDKELAFFLAPFRAWELLLGAALALRTGRILLPAWGAEVAAGFGLSLIVASVVLLDESQPFPGLLALPACLGAGLLIFTGTEHKPLVNRMLSLRPFVTVGLISYSLYLWHWPLLSFARYHYGRQLQWHEVACLLGASLLLSLATYRYVELPARRLRPDLAPRVLGLGLLSVAMIAVGGGQLAASRWTYNLDPELRRFDATATLGNTYRRNCSGPKNIFRDDDACTFGAARRSRSYDMVVFGDSHADHYVPAMSVLAKKAEMSGRQISIGACLALLGYFEVTSPFSTEADCRSLREAMLTFVESNPGLRLAVLAHNWSIYTGNTIWKDEKPIYVLGSKHDVRSQQRSLEVLTQSLAQTLDLFEKRGIHVLLMGEIPLLNSDPLRCLAAAASSERERGCRIAAKEVQERVGKMNALLADFARRRKDVTFFSPLSAMCDQNSCGPVVEGVFMYRDRSHLNRVGAEHLARTMSLPHLLPRL